MAEWIVRDGMIGYQPIEDVSTTQNHPFGTIVKARSLTYGEGEFIYVKGVTNGVAGAACTYSHDDGSTTLLVANGIGPVGFMMSALDATTDFGWLQINGEAAAITTTASGAVADAANLYATATGGQIDDTVVTGDRIWGAKAAGINTTLGVLRVEINRPFVNDALNAGTS